MKNYTILLTFLIAFAIVSCENSDNKQVSTDVVKNTKSAVEHAELGAVPMISFEGIKHDFGDVIQGEKVTYNFIFHNTGGSDLLISKVSTSCGCTVGKYPKELIKPGEGGEVFQGSERRRHPLCRPGRERGDTGLVSGDR